MTKSTVYLVGAGPGDKELITWKGLKALRSAQVILYDSLINSDLLDEAPEDSIKICVGKRAGKVSMRQEAINELLLFYARSYEKVVRLKGGDPFVFGRGHEEVAYLRAARIETLVIPGISSALAVPAALGIPITHREISRGFTVITATQTADVLNQEIKIAASGATTLVVLMGIRKLEAIVAACLKCMPVTTPIAIAWNGTYANQKSVVSDLSQILDRPEIHEKNSGPGIIIIGEVVALSDQLSNHVKLALLRA